MRRYAVREDQVSAIRVLYSEGNTLQKVADVYGISICTAFNIITGKHAFSKDLPNISRGRRTTHKRHKLSARLKVDPSKLKVLRETLCAAQSMIPDTFTRSIDSIQLLINEIDRHRPLGPNGNHGDLHTTTCGCEDK